MLSIRVNNKEIYIKKGTSIQMEVNNAVFSTDEIPGEIIYTFDVPAQPNDKIFNYARFVYVKKIKRFGAEILVGGIPVANGDLYIQQATKTSYSLGLVVNPFPPGWTEKKLNETDHGEIVISKNSTEHQDKWREFLKNSLKENADIKFPLFIDENFYGGKNPDFGFVDGKQAALYPYGNRPPALEKFFVNRLFVNGNDLAELESSLGIRIFNNVKNSFCFCPAINLFYFVDLFFKNIDVNLTGNFFDNKKLKKLYYQSLNSLDGSLSDFDDIKLGVFIKTNKELVSHNYKDNSIYLHTIMNCNGEEMQYFKAKESGLTHFDITVNIILPEVFFDEQPSTTSPLLLMYIMPEMFVGHRDPIVEPAYLGGLNPFFGSPNAKLYYEERPTPEEIPTVFVKPLIQLELNPYTGNLTQLKYSFDANIQKDKIYRFYINRYTTTSVEFDSLNLDLLTNSKLNLFDTPGYPFNYFSKKLIQKHHTPNLSNGEFINTLKQTFGLALYIDQQKKEIELSFIKDIINSGYIQLDKYLLTNETTISETEETEIVYKFPPVTDNEIDESRLMAEVQSIDDLLSAKNNFGKIAFIRNQNKFVEGVKEGDAVENWIYKYKKYCGNNKTISAGEGETQEVSPAVLIPNMKDIDRVINAKDVILEIDKTGVSPLISTGTTEFELVLINCPGLKTLTKAIDNVYYKFESAELVSADNTKTYDLCVTGENSIGENFIAPWLNLLVNHETITHKFLFDVKTFLLVWRLLKPQSTTPEQQTRWVMVQSIKLLPKKITFQFTEGKDYILAEIEFAKPN